MQQLSLVNWYWNVVQDEKGNNVVEVDTTSTENQGAGANFGSKDWTDYALEYRLRLLNPSADTGVMFRREIGVASGYVLQFGPRYGAVTLLITPHGGPWQQVVSRGYGVRTNTWYHIRIEAVASALRVYVDDKLQLQLADSRISSGGCSVGVAPGTRAQFDDIRVTALGKSS